MIRGSGAWTSLYIKRVIFKPTQSLAALSRAITDGVYAGLHINYKILEDGFVSTRSIYGFGDQDAGGLVLASETSGQYGIVSYGGPFEDQNKLKAANRVLDFGDGITLQVFMKTSGVYGQYKSYRVEKIILAYQGTQTVLTAGLLEQAYTKDSTHHGLLDRMHVTVGDQSYGFGAGYYDINGTNVKTDSQCRDLSLCGRPL